jgi:hypothetical protein
MANQVIIDETRNQISVIEGQTRIIEVAAQGPQGPVGPRGEAGPSGSSILNQITSGSVTASVDTGFYTFRVSNTAQPYLSLAYETSGILRHQNSTPPYFTLNNNNAGVNMNPGQAVGYIEIGGARAGSVNTMVRFSTTYIGDGNSRNARLSLGTAEGTGFGGNQFAIFKLSSGSFLNRSTAVIGVGVDSYSTSSTDITGLYASRATTIINGASGNNIASFDSVGLPQTVLFSNGNWGINTFIDGGEKLQVTGTTRLAGNTTITGSLLVTGNITAQTLVVQTITSSVLYSSGSNIFGNSLTNTQQFTGSVSVTGSLSVNGGVVSTGTGISGQVAYWNGTSSQTGSNNLFWDAANSRLGIGTNVPSHPLNILSANAALGFRLEHATPSSVSFPFQITNSADTNYVRANVNIIEFFRNGGASTIRTKGSNNELLIQSFRHLQLAVNDGTIAAQLYSSGNLVLQNGGTFSDTGERLQVSGSSRFGGNMFITGSATITAGADVYGASTFTIGGGTYFRLAGALGGQLSYSYAEYIGALYYAGFSGTTVGMRGTSAVLLGNTATSYPFVVASDRVAIGHLSPTALLHVSGTTGGLFEIDSNTASNILYVSSSGNVGIGTNTPTAPLTINTNSNFGNGINVTNSSTGDIARSQINVINNSGNQGNLSIWGTGTGLANKVLFESTKDFIIGTDSGTPSGGTSKFQIYVGGYNAVTNPQLTLHAGGNLSLGSTSDSGDRLQVIGSSRFNGNVLISGSGATSGTNGLLVQNSSAVSTFIVRNDGRISNGDSSFYVDRYAIGGTVMTISTIVHNGATGIQVTSAVGIRAASNLGVSGDNLLGASIYAAGGANAGLGNISLGLLSNRALITSTASGMNMHTSSMLQVDSTVQGFLPPRMTTTQKNAITTPAAGLVVYDTTLAKLCVYTTGWETITSS